MKSSLPREVTLAELLTWLTAHWDGTVLSGSLLERLAQELKETFRGRRL